MKTTSNGRIWASTYTGANLDAAITAALEQLSGNQGLTDFALTNDALAENSPVGRVVRTLSASDPHAGETFTFALTDDAGGLFAINGTNLVVTGPLDYEAAISHNVTVQVTDAANNTLDKMFAITTTNVNEAPISCRLLSRTPQQDLSRTISRAPMTR